MIRTHRILGFLFTAAALAQVPVPPSGNVTLPVEEYNRLMDAAARPPKQPAAAPMPFVLHRAELKFDAGADTASGTIDLEGAVFADAPVKVPLVSGITVFDARQKNRDLPLLQEDGAEIAVLPGGADFSVTLQGGLPIRMEPGRASMEIPAPAAGAVHLVLTVPGEGANVNLSPGLITARSSANGHTVVEATLLPGHSATAWWATRESKPAPTPVPREVRFL